jgi:hypothetical protein
MFLSKIIKDQCLPSKKLKLETWSENDIASNVSRSLKELFEYSDEIDYPSFLTDEALSAFPPPSTAADVQPAGIDTTASSDAHAYGPLDQNIAHDVEYLGDEKT